MVVSMATTTIITSDRYIAVRNNNGDLTFNRTLRVITQYNGKTYVVPCRWDENTQRLESVSLGKENFIPAMYSKTKKNMEKVEKLFPDAEWLMLEDAKRLTE